MSALEVAKTAQWPLQRALVLGALPTAVGCARLHAKSVMCEWGLAIVAETVELVVSELVTNAVRAATGPDGHPNYGDGLPGLPVVHVRLLSDRVRTMVEVWDSNREGPVAREAGPDDESGRGLMLVEALCERWGWQGVPGWTGKVVWALVTSGSRADGTV